MNAKKQNDEIGRVFGRLWLSGSTKWTKEMTYDQKMKSCYFKSAIEVLEQIRAYLF